MYLITTLDSSNSYLKKLLNEIILKQMNPIPPLGSAKDDVRGCNLNHIFVQKLSK